MMRRSFILAVCSALLIGCQSDEGDKYVGNWQSEQKPAGRPHLSIVRTEKTFTIKMTTGPGWKGQGSVQTMIATLKDGMLHTNEGLVLALDPTTGILNGGKLEFSRVK